MAVGRGEVLEAGASWLGASFDSMTFSSLGGEGDDAVTEVTSSLPGTGDGALLACKSFRSSSNSAVLVCSEVIVAA